MPLPTNKPLRTLWDTKEGIWNIFFNDVLGPFALALSAVSIFNTYHRSRTDAIVVLCVHSRSSFFWVDQCVIEECYAKSLSLQISHFLYKDPGPRASQALFFTSPHQTFVSRSEKKPRANTSYQPLFLITVQPLQTRDRRPQTQHPQPHISTMKLSLTVILAMVATALAGPRAQTADTAPAFEPKVNSLCAKETSKSSQPSCPDCR